MQALLMPGWPPAYTNMKRSYTNRDDVPSYKLTVYHAVQELTELTVETVRWEGTDIFITVSEAPTQNQIATVNDVMSATEYFPVDTAGQPLHYRQQQVDPEDPDLPDDHMHLSERIAQQTGSPGTLGRDIGEVRPEEVSVNPFGPTVDVEVPDAATNEDIERLDNTMLAFGKVPVE